MRSNPCTLLKTSPAATQKGGLGASGLAGTGQVEGASLVGVKVVLSQEEAAAQAEHHHSAHKVSCHCQNYLTPRLGKEPPKRREGASCVAVPSPASLCSRHKAAHSSNVSFCDPRKLILQLLKIG